MVIDDNEYSHVTKNRKKTYSLQISTFYSTEIIILY